MDKRVIKTRNKVKEGILKIYGNQPLENYPIKFLCKEIGLNRTTFYIHYSCLDDVIEDLANEVCETLEKKFKGHTDDTNFVVTTLVNYINENKKLFVMILNESKMKWVNNTIETFRPCLYETPLIASIKNFYEREYAISFLVHGTYGLLGRWIKDDFKEERTYVIKRLLKFIRTGEYAPNC